MSCEDDDKKCRADRREKALAVIAAAEPWETHEQLAAKVPCTRKTIERMLRRGTIVPDCNELLNLKDLYADDVPYWTQRPVSAVEAALQACSREQLAYLFSEVLPIFHTNLRKGNVKVAA